MQIIIYDMIPVSKIDFMIKENQLARFRLFHAKTLINDYS